jgi:lysozyme
MNWKRTRLAGAQFAFIKATDGASIIDEQFKANWPGSKEAGLLRGAYHYFRNSVDPIAQAELFIKTVGLMGPGWGELPLVIDLEDTSRPPAKTSVEQQARKFCDFVAAETSGDPVMVYTNYSWGLSNLKDPSWMQFPLWIAGYTRTVPSVPNPWLPGMQKVWQVEASPYGAYYGASSPKIDRDVMHYDSNY